MSLKWRAQQFSRPQNAPILPVQRPPPTFTLLAPRVLPTAHQCNPFDDLANSKATAISTANGSQQLSSCLNGNPWLSSLLPAGSYQALRNLLQGRKVAILWVSGLEEHSPSANTIPLPTLFRADLQCPYGISPLLLNLLTLAAAARSKHLPPRGSAHHASLALKLTATSGT